MSDLINTVSPTPPMESRPPTPQVVAPQSNNRQQNVVPVCHGTSEQSSGLPFDDVFNFQLVVFEVEGTLFRVPKNAFNLPGTIFETMFSLPPPPLESGDVDKLAVEGLSPEKPIHLADVSAKDFRAFLRISYPFTGPSASLTYEDWVGILKLSSMWDFRQIRQEAISRLSMLIKEKTPAERISLGRAFQVSDWLRDEYIKLAQRPELKLDDLRNSSDMSLDWETIAKILSVREQTFLRMAKKLNGRQTCVSCAVPFGWKTEVIDCHCNISSAVESIFRDEFAAMREPATETMKKPAEEGSVY